MNLRPSNVNHFYRIRILFFLEIRFLIIIYSSYDNLFSRFHVHQHKVYLKSLLDSKVFLRQKKKLKQAYFILNASPILLLHFKRIYVMI